MTHNPEPTRLPTRIADIGYQFLDPDPLGDEERSAQFSAQILDQDGVIIRVRNGDMVPHAEPEEILTMLALFATWRERAEAQMIPAP